VVERQKKILQEEMMSLNEKNNSDKDVL